MSESEEFIIGSEVACSDGVCGDLRRVVVDPVARAITHLAVEPRQRGGTGRLVPIDLVTSSVGKEIRLRCTQSEFHALEDAEETQFLPGASGQWGYPQDQMISLPYYGLGPGGMGAGVIGTGMGVGAVPLGGIGSGTTGPHPATYDHIPVGEVEVRRGDHVDATDGAIGRVQGLVIDPSDHRVTHFLLAEGHPWGEKTVAIPISAVAHVGEVVRLELTKDEVRDLPPVDVDHRD